MCCFPKEIISNILFRLPVDSLCRFRCVSKPWCELIRDPIFVEKHLNHAIKEENSSVIFRDSSLYSIDYHQSSTFYEAVKMDYPYHHLRAGVEIFGSCNGLLCVNTGDGVDIICMWNPSTKEYKKLPTSKIKFPAADFYCCDKTSYGFGFDSKTKDYKLVRLVGFNFEHGCEVKVYTSGTNTWKSLNYIPYRLSYGRTPAVLVNGALHWITTLIVPEDKSVSGSDEDPRLILSFDISNESFQEIPKPDMLNDKFHNNVDVLDGYLCLLSNNYKVHVDMWVMKGYGVRESWTKLFTISQQSFIRAFDYVKPILSFKNGMVLLDVDGGALVLYDPKYEESRIIEVCNVEWCEIFTYTRSLVGREQKLEAIKNIKKPEIRKTKKEEKFEKRIKRWLKDFSRVMETRQSWKLERRLCLVVVCSGGVVFVMARAGAGWIGCLDFVLEFEVQTT